MPMWKVTSSGWVRDCSPQTRWMIQSTVSRRTISSTTASSSAEV